MAELEKDTLYRLKEYLIEHGYPQESLSAEYPLGNCRIDLVVIDPLTNMPIQAFEIKSHEKLKGFGIKQLTRISNEASKTNADIITYLVFPLPDYPFIKVERIDIIDNEIKKQEAIENLNFNLQSTRAKSKAIDNIDTKKKETVDNFNLCSRILALIVFLILLLDIFCCLEINNIRLYLIITSITLVLFPFFHTIKLFNLEISRFADKK